jgi:hypothetical protein
MEPVRRKIRNGKTYIWGNETVRVQAQTPMVLLVAVPDHGVPLEVGCQVASGAGAGLEQPIGTLDRKDFTAIDLQGKTAVYVKCSRPLGHVIYQITNLQN